MRRRITILGCGPAGLLVAHAAQQLGYRITILSKKRKSQIYGAQYLHKEIPGINIDSQEIRHQLVGTPEEYRRKVYGELTVPFVSVDDDRESNYERAYDLRTAYQLLWARYDPHIINAAIDYAMAKRICDDYETYGEVWSTIPAPLLCLKPEHHRFRTREIWAIGDAPGQQVPIRPPVEDGRYGRIVCNGMPEPGWYRMSSIFGHVTVEWPITVLRVPIQGVVKVQKPIDHECDCLPNITRFGRYGAWDKSVLLHNVYYRAIEVLAES